MKKEDLIKKLEELNIPDIEPANHKRRLKMVLLASGNFKKRRFGDFFPIRKIIQECLMPKRRFAFIGSLLGVAVIAIVASTMLVSMKSTPVNAQQVAQKTYQTVAGLSSDEQELLTKTIKINDPLKLVEEAQNAKDLKVYNYQEFISQNPDIQSVLENPVDSNNNVNPIQTIDWSKVQFLEFTESEGGKVLLAVDPTKNHLPIFVSISISSGDDHFGAASFSISEMQKGEGFENATITVTTKSVIVEENGIVTVRSGEDNGTIMINGKEYGGTEEAQGATFTVEQQADE